MKLSTKPRLILTSNSHILLRLPARLHALVLQDTGGQVAKRILMKRWNMGPKMKTLKSLSSWI
jgi:hypothetical protein